MLIADSRSLIADRRQLVLIRRVPRRHVKPGWIQLIEAVPHEYPGGRIVRRGVGRAAGVILVALDIPLAAGEADGAAP